MSNYIDNNINFTNVKATTVPVGGVVGVRGEQGVDPEYGGVINAIDIDWNGAQVAGETLNTTGEVLSLINDNITNIENVNSSLQNHSHSNYATQDYVTEKINEASIPGGGSSLTVEEFSDTEQHYNLLVAEEGAKYTTIGSLADASNTTGWASNLYATVDGNGDITLNTTNLHAYHIQCETANIPHTHSNYAPTDHSHEYVATAGTAETADSADYAKLAGTATTADLAETANYATTAGSASSAENAQNANYATTAGSSETANYATTAETADSADYALTAYHAEWADKAEKWSNPAIIHIGNQGRSLNAGDNFTLTLDEIGAASTTHTHTDYATKSYVTEQINNSGSSGLNVEDFYDHTRNYNLLVAEEGAKYTTIGSLSDGGSWASNLHATVDETGNTTLYAYDIQASNNIIANYIKCKTADIPHEHSNYATTTSIENLQNQVMNLASRIIELEELVGGGSSSDPDNPDLTPRFYFYVGETQPTADNYTTLCTSYTDLKYPLSANYTVLSASGAPVYILVSEGLSEDRKVTKIVDSNNTPISFSSITTGINMNTVYKTEEISGGEIITITLTNIINQ